MREWLSPVQPTPQELSLINAERGFTDAERELVGMGLSSNGGAPHFLDSL